MSFFEDWFDDASGGTSKDTTPPTITKVSPVAFDADYAVARVTPIVVDITDATPGLGTIVVTKADSVVYFGSPVAAYGVAYTGSSIVAITNGYRLSFYPTAGWDSGALALTVVAIDGDGNMASLGISLDVPYPSGVTVDGSPQEFRDSIWRWRRRLRRQKCSVISVAIDDNYTIGRGFTLTALALELARRKGLDRVPWRGGSITNTHGSGDVSNGR